MNGIFFCFAPFLAHVRQILSEECGCREIAKEREREGNERWKKREFADGVNVVSNDSRYYSEQDS